jgi:hypothetical protein
MQLIKRKNMKYNDLKEKVDTLTRVNKVQENELSKLNNSILIKNIENNKLIISKNKLKKELCFCKDLEQVYIKVNRRSDEINSKLIILNLITLSLLITSFIVNIIK